MSVSSFRCFTTATIAAAESGIAQYKGKTYYFCAPVCKTKFEKVPEQYVYAGGSSKSGWCH